MNVSRSLAIAAVLSAAVLVAPASADDAASAAPDFGQQIAPLFRQYCVGCHSVEDPEHGLALDSYEGLLAGGDGGPVLFAGRGEQSRLLMVLDGRAEPSMPPEDNERPTAAEIALLKAWIDAGAKGPSGEGPDPTLLVTPQVELLAPARNVINAAEMSPDGKLVALAGYRQVRLVAADSRATVRTLAGHRGNVTDIAFSTDGSQLISAAGEPGLFGEVIVWNVADGAPIRTIVGHADSIYAAALSPDGALIATGSYDQRIKLWDVSTGQEARTIEGHNGAVFDLAFSPDGRLLASASADRTVKLWDVATGARLDTFGQSLKEIYAVAFSPDGRRVVAGGVDNRLRVWQISDTAREGTNPILLTRFAHEGAIIKVAFSPDGGALVSSAEDRTVRIWEAEGLTERVLLEEQPDWAAALALGPDNKSLVVGRLDGSFALYDAASGAAIPPPKPELASLWPRGVERGKPARIKLKGANLLAASKLEVSDQRIAAAIQPAETERADELWVEITPAADLPRGTYQVAVVTPGGTSGQLALEVDDLAQRTEAEPNNAPAEATLLAMPAGHWGVLAERGDMDCVAFEARAGQTIVCELSAKRLGSQLNAVLTILDPAGQVVASNNDFDGQDDPLVGYQVAADGRYTVRIKDLALTGSDKHFYRLTIGELPYVTGVYPLSVPANQEAEVELAGFNLPADAKVLLAAGPPGDRPVSIDPARFRAARGLTVLASNSVELRETESNDLAAQATPIVVPGSAGGRLWSQGDAASPDVDLFRFESAAGQGWIIETEAERRGSPADTKIEVLDAEGRPVERLLLQAVRDSYIDFRGVDSNAAGVRPKNWEEMELNEYMYLQGEVCKIFRMPQGPDSEIQFYTLAGRRRCYFDTSATGHPLDENIYIVEPHPAGTPLTPNGLPVFPLYYANDDDGDRQLGRDSRLTFTAPADGAYLVRVSDVRGYGGDRFAYRLTVRAPQPDFQVSLADTNPTVHAGSGRRLSFSAKRVDGFDGDITVEIEGLPPGVSASGPVVIQAGHSEARAVLTAAADAVAPPADAWAQVRITARAEVDGQPVDRDVNGLGQVTLAEKPNLLVRVEPAELAMAPGTTITATLKVERNGFDDLVTFDVDNLPHGVIVDNIGLNGVLIPAGQSERQIFLTAAKWVPDTSRPFHAVANNAAAQASPAVVLHVRKPDTVAQAEPAR